MEIMLWYIIVIIKLFNPLRGSEIQLSQNEFNLLFILIL